MNSMVFDNVIVWVPGGSLGDVIVKKEVQGELFSEAELKDLLLQVSMGLKYIHSSGLVHLDIKPSESHLAVLSLRFLFSLNLKALVPKKKTLPSF